MNTKKILGVVAVLALVAVAMVGAGAAAENLIPGVNIQDKVTWSGSSGSYQATISAADTYTLTTEWTTSKYPAITVNASNVIIDGGNNSVTNSGSFYNSVFVKIGTDASTGNAVTGLTIQNFVLNNIKYVVGGNSTISYNTIQNITINNGNSWASSLVWSYDFDDIDIAGNTISNITVTGDDCYVILADTCNSSSGDITIANNTIENVTNKYDNIECIRPEESSTLAITGNLINGVYNNNGDTPSYTGSAVGLMVRSPSESCTISGNTISNITNYNGSFGYNAGVWIGTSTASYTVTDNIITNCKADTSSNQGFYGIWIGDTDHGNPYIISGNTIDISATGVNGMIAGIYGHGNVTVESNDISVKCLGDGGDNTTYGVLFVTDGGCTLIVNNNTIMDDDATNKLVGILVAPDSDEGKDTIIITDNTITGSGNSVGLELYGTAINVGSQIYNNKINTGLYVDNSGDNSGDVDSVVSWNVTPTTEFGTHKKVVDGQKYLAGNWWGAVSEGKASVNGYLAYDTAAEAIAAGFPVGDLAPLVVSIAKAKIGNTFYATLKDAVAAVPTTGAETTITLIGDPTLDSELVISDGRNVKLVMNDGDTNHIINTGTNSINVENGTLNITGTGTVTGAPSAQKLIYLVGSTDSTAENYSNLTIGSDVVVSDTNDSYGVIISNNSNCAYGVNVTINGTIDTTYGVFLNGQINKTTGNVPNFIIDGATIVNGIYAAGYANWVFTNTTMVSIEGENAGDVFSLKSGNFVINSGTYTSKSPYAVPAEGHYSGSEDTGAAVSIMSNDSYAKELNVTINGGTFTSVYGNAVYEGIAQISGQPVAEASYAVVAINGGIFQSADGKDVVSINQAENKQVITGGKYNASPSGTFIAPGYRVNTIVEDSKTWYVVEKDVSDSVTVSYNANGGSGDIASQITSKGGSVTLADPTALELMKTGYTFETGDNSHINWYTTSACSGTPCVGGDDLSNIQSDVTLYPKWEPVHYTVKFSTEHGSAPADITDVSYDAIVGGESGLPAVTDASGYTFQGWAVTNGGNVVYAGGQKVKGLSGDGSTVTLYAVLAADASTHAVSGTTYVGETGTSGIKLQLMKGNATYGNEITSDSNGAFTFSGIPDGTYDLVAKYTDGQSNTTTVTKGIVISGGDMDNVDVTFVSGMKVESEVVVSTENNTGAVVVSNVDKVAEGATSSATSSVKVIATVQNEIKGDATSTEEQEVQYAIGRIDSLAGGDGDLTYMNFTVTQQIDNGAISELDHTSTVLEFIIPYDAKTETITGVYRYHGTSATALTKLAAKQTEPVSGWTEGYFVDTTAGNIYVYADKFSVYAYSTAKESAGNTQVKMVVEASYEFSVPDSVTLEPTENAVVYGEVSLTANPDNNTKVSIKVDNTADDTSAHTFNMTSSTSSDVAKYAMKVSGKSGDQYTVMKSVLTGSEIVGTKTDLYNASNNIVLRIKETGIVSGTKYYLGFITKQVPGTSGTYTDTLTFELTVEN